jgi:hypothetical protein
MKQRIALLAATALGFGVLSASPAFAVAIVANDVDIISTLKTEICTVDTDKEVAYVPSSSVGVKISAAGAADAETGFLTISGPAVWTAVTAGTADAIVINSQKEAEITDAGTTPGSATLKPTGVGTILVTVSATSGGVALDTLTIYSQASCVGGVYSASDSFLEMDTATAGNAADNVDNKTSTTAGTPMYIKILPKDAYAAAISTGTLSVTATNGAVVSLGASGGALAAGSLSAASGTISAAHAVRVDPAQSATTSTTVVTLTHNGTPVGTKNITFHGEQAKIVVGTVFSGRTSTSSGAFTFTYQDSAGNTVPGNAAAVVAASTGTRITTATSVLAPSTSSTTLIGTAVTDDMEYKLGGTSSAGVMTYTCGSSAGTADFTIATTSTVNANTLTATVTGKCYGGISTYTVSTDKATYNVGDVAVITIEAKDSSGNPVSDNSRLQASSVSVGGGTLTYTLLGTDAAAAVESFTNGKVSLRAQMTTAGTFNTVVSLTGAVTSSATTGYKVSSSDVSNAEVLKSIVALIASINKQIAALQKLILRR